MRDVAYMKSPVKSQYLSGAFMFCRRSILDQVNWFSPEYFMYLEDADLTRKMSSISDCIHDPNICVEHEWRRGSHSSFKLMIVAIYSFLLYSLKWGFRFL